MNAGRSDPRNPATRARLQREALAAMALHGAGRTAQATHALEVLLGGAPPVPDLLAEVGILALRSNLIEQGAAWLGRSLSLEPRNALHWALRGAALSRLQRFQEALHDLGCAIELAPSNADAYFDRGCAHRALGLLGEALADFDRALALDPFNSAAHANRGALLHELGRGDESLQSCLRAVEIAPDYVQAHYNLGVALEALGRLGEALQSYDRAISIDPLHPRTAPAHANRGVLLNRMGRRHDALQSCERSVAVDGRYAQAHYNLGTILEEAGRYDEALPRYERALAIDPEHVGANWNRAILQLLRGRFDEGWRGYEWRWRGPQKLEPRRHDSRPLWLGDKPLKGKTILLYAEQGLGDTLQFCRYSAALADQGARVLLEVYGPLRALLRSVPGVAEVYAIGDPLPDFDYQCPLLSLPLACKTTLESIPAAVPYLHADEGKVRAWQEQLGPRTKLRVGLVWSGGFRPSQPETWPVNARRNIPLRLMQPLRNSEIDFYSLQKGQPGESEWAELRLESWGGPDLIDRTSDLQDFSDTAALVENLDLVISVDTSTAHLAAALGRPVWILNRFDTCWRWLLDRSDSPWYPTVCLYRQTTPGDWEDVIQRVRTDLLQLVR